MKSVSETRIPYTNWDKQVISMNLIKCKNNHFYDSEKFLSCPHCANKVAEPTIKDILGEEQSAVCTDPPEMRPSFDSSNATTKKTVGWLVCISGNMLGESFILREGDNRIGRATSMDICLSYEPTVSRDRHAIITYNSARNAFVLHSSEHEEQILCNHKKIKNRKTIKNHDIITLGDCSLLFVALCGPDFCWGEDQTTQ